MYRCHALGDPRMDHGHSIIIIGCRETTYRWCSASLDFSVGRPRGRSGPWLGCKTGETGKNKRCRLRSAPGCSGPWGSQRALSPIRGRHRVFFRPGAWSVIGRCDAARMHAAGFFQVACERGMLRPAQSRRPTLLDSCCQGPPNLMDGRGVMEKPTTYPTCTTAWNLGSAIGRSSVREARWSRKTHPICS